MKLREWADKIGVKYLTAYRWFKAGTLPVKAYQTESGTIIVEDDFDNLEQSMNTQDNDVMKLFLKKTVEFSSNGSTVEDFAAFVLSNFNLKPNTVSDSPKYSRVKPKPEDVQDHFKQFIKKGDKPKPTMFVAPPEAVKEIAEQENWSTPKISPLPEDFKVKVDAIDKVTISGAELDHILHLGDTEGVVERSVDLTPQQLNYTGSSNPTFGSTYSGSPLGSSIINNMAAGSISVNSGAHPFESLIASSSATGAFTPTQKELQSLQSVAQVADKPKRGRKSHKKDKL